MLSKGLAKYIISLQSKKGRREHGAYLLEGEKLVLEFLASQQRCQNLVVVDEWLKANEAKLERVNSNALVVCAASEMKKISALQTPSPLLAVADIPVYELLPQLMDLTIVLDGIQDPGNMGTIVRTADWFGLKHVFASDDTVDAYNPKTVQAAMGSLLRVQVIERNLDEVFNRYADTPVYAADMNGVDVRSESLKTPALLLIGNEGNGIKAQWQRFITNTVSIPRFGGAESLNAAVATAILCSRWKLA
jgi:RNA methyltransferase, TrmH family